MDPRVQKMADCLVNYSIRVRPGDWVVVRSSTEGEPLVQACMEAILRAGANPSYLFSSSTLRETAMRASNEDQLLFVSPLDRLVIERADAMITILAPRNTRSLASIDPKKMAIAGRAGEEVTKIYLDRWARDELSWTIAQYPTEAAAQEAGMSLHDYEEFVYGAGLLNEPDPVAAWKALGERQQRLVEWLTGASEIRLAGEGTDLRLDVRGRAWQNDDGRGNFPGGEVYTSPVENGTEGTIAFNLPAVYRGREVDGIRLRFEAGRVVDASARSDESYLHQMLDIDQGARVLGEFAIGTNPGIQRFTRNTLFDEKIGGTIHMALGASVPDTGGNNTSSLHWDIVYSLREGAELTVDGRPFSRNGEILV